MGQINVETNYKKISGNITCVKDHILIHQRNWRAQFHYMKVSLH